MAFTAKYRGSCANECGSPIEPGDAVQYNWQHELEHEFCQPKIDISIPICGKCNMSKPCECDDQATEQAAKTDSTEPGSRDATASYFEAFWRVTLADEIRQAHRNVQSYANPQVKIETKCSSGTCTCEAAANVIEKALMAPGAGRSSDGSRG